MNEDKRYELDESLQLINELKQEKQQLQNKLDEIKRLYEFNDGFTVRIMDLKEIIEKLGK